MDHYTNGIAIFVIECMNDKYETETDSAVADTIFVPYFLWECISIIQ